MAACREELRRKALLSAGSVVLALGLGACGPKAPSAEAAGGGEAASPARAEAQAVEPAEEAESCDDIAWQEVSSCCEELRARCSERHGDGGQGWVDCAFGPDMDGSTGCTPWGPPVPPRFTGGSPSASRCPPLT